MLNHKSVTSSVTRGAALRIPTPHPAPPKPTPTPAPQQQAWAPRLEAAVVAGVLLASCTSQATAAPLNGAATQMQGSEVVSQGAPLALASVTNLQAPPLAAIQAAVSDDVAALQSEIDNVKSKIQGMQQEEADELQEIRDLEARVATQAKVLRQDSSSSSQEIRDLQAKLDAKKELLEQALKERGSAVPAEEAPSNGGLSPLNVAGVLALGGVGGLVAVTKKNREETETELSRMLESEVKALAALRAQVESVKKRLAEEERVSGQLRVQLNMINESNKAALAVERVGRESAQRAAREAQTSVDKQVAIVNALKQEMAAAEANIAKEQARQNTATKAKVKSEAELTQVLARLDQQLSTAMKVGKDTRTALDSVKEMQKSMGKTVISAQSLMQDLSVERIRAQGAEDEVAVLKAQVFQAETDMKESQEAAERLGAMVSDMKGKLADMNKQSTQLFSISVKDANQAAHEMASAEADLEEANNKLAAERDMLEKLKGDSTALRIALKDSHEHISELQTSVTSLGNDHRSLSSEVEVLLGQLEATEERLALQQTENAATAEEIAALKASLNSIQSQLDKAMKEVEALRTSNALLQRSVTVTKEEIKLNGQSTERESGLSVALQRQAGTLQRQVSEEKSSNAALRKELNDLDKSLRKKVSDVAAQLDQAQAVRKSAEGDAAALAGEINVLRKQLKELGIANNQILNQSRAFQEAYRRDVEGAKRQIDSLEAAAKAAAGVEKQMAEKIAELQAFVERQRKECKEMMASSDASLEELNAEKEKRAIVDKSMKELKEQLDVMLSSNAGAKEAADKNLKELKGRFEHLRSRVASKSFEAEKVAGPKNPDAVAPTAAEASKASEPSEAYDS